MKCQQRRNHDQNRRFVANIQTVKISFGLKVSRLPMAFDSKPVIEGLKWKVRIGRRFHFDDDQSSGLGDRQKIDNVAILPNKTRHLWINSSGTNWKKISDLPNQIGLQPALFVSARQRMTAAVPPLHRKSIDQRLKRFPHRIG